MGKFFVKSSQVGENELTIIGEDVNHIKNVLRLNIADQIKVCDLDNSINYNCEIVRMSSEEIRCRILEKLQNNSEGNVELHIFQGLPKSDKMELVIQKGTELGVSEFIPVRFSRCIVKISGKDEIKKVDRWNKISEVASKQCGRDIIPKVTNIANLKDVCNKIKDYDLVLLAYEMEEENFIKNELEGIRNTKEKYKIAVIIGPEGGIERNEAEMLENSGAKVISLGRRILRTETVAMQVSSIIMYELENGGN